MAQGIIEPIEEVGYRTRPPLLEDVSIEGPFRTPISHALDTLPQRDAIEEDYNWWRYSRFAAPWLIFMLLLLVSLMVLTGYTQVGTLKALRDGTPRYYMLEVITDADTEAGVKIENRNVRISAVVIAGSAVLIAFLTVYAKPVAPIRKVICFICGVLLFVAFILAFISLGIGQDESKNHRRCEALRVLTNERCRRREHLANAALAMDIALGIACFFAAVVVFFTTFTGDFKFARTGWREEERDQEREKKKKKDEKWWDPRYRKLFDYQRRTRLWITLGFLALVLAICIIQIVLIVLMHRDHDVLELMGFRGRTSTRFDGTGTRREPFEEAGWSARNTRLRYAWTSIGILTILLNFLPWRSRVIAWIFFFFYFIVGAMAFVSFGMDVHEMRASRDLGCPGTNSQLPYQGLTQWQRDILSSINTRTNCVNGEFVAIAVLEFMLGIAVVIYLLNEYLIRSHSIHSGRDYPWFEVGKIERRYDSRRPVRCELTSKVMTAKEYYYQHRFLAGPSVEGSSVFTGRTGFTANSGL
eukprot:TRINITY_DN63990_c0_g1_i1.p1 TRINITY_DN63990_c0_g1~~TRINITY_DN63990_c0_g1_i1.p1  ORF type:complete len:528 (+),score=39.22 TRINITY_DN63990_c0_g1_i1:131-1714(+)